MHGTWLIEVGYKDGVSDPTGLGLEKDCQHAGIKGVKKIAVSQLYRLVGELTPEQRTRLANDLLTDPIIQASRDGALREPGATTVDVCFKTGVTDVVGDTVMKGIRDLGVQGVAEVRTGLRYRFAGVKREELGRKVALTFLANPLIQDVFIHVD
jgi:phosphoribosylformylglycinamidine (FGAM) synthase PurS component